jgi:hypothetical protein
MVINSLNALNMKNICQKKEELRMSHDCIFSMMWERIYNAYWFDALACVEIVLTEGMLELADFPAWGKTYKCEVYNGTSLAFCVHGMCKVQSTQQFALEFYVMSGYLSCHAGHVQAPQGNFAAWSKTC